MKFLKALVHWLRPKPRVSEMTPLFSEVERPRRAAQVVVAPESLPYKVYTHEFDRIVTGDQLDSVFGTVGPVGKTARDEAWQAFHGALQGWRMRSQIGALEASEKLRATTSAIRREDTVVTILLDQSGSMRGQNMLLAAAAVDIAQDFLRNLGCAVEILGFTTTTWKGGKSREKWRRDDKPPWPGRLCDLLHVIYRDAEDMRTSGGGWNFQPMLHPDLPKENVDGEALEWAAGRLRLQTRERKILLVISDGAPVDDSTLHDNDPGILERHLLEVIANLKAEGRIEIAAIGIGHDVTRYYEQATMIQSAEDLGEELIALLQAILSVEKPLSVRTVH